MSAFKGESDTFVPDNGNVTVKNSANEERRPSCYYQCLGGVHVHTATLFMSSVASVILAGVVISILRKVHIDNAAFFGVSLVALCFAAVVYGNVKQMPIFYVPVVYGMRPLVLGMILYNIYDFVDNVDRLNNDYRTVGDLKYQVNRTFNNIINITVTIVLLGLLNVMARDYDYILKVLQRPFATIRGQPVHFQNVASRVMAPLHRV